MNLHDIGKPCCQKPKEAAGIRFMVMIGWGNRSQLVSAETEGYKEAELVAVGQRTYVTACPLYHFLIPIVPALRRLFALGTDTIGLLLLALPTIWLPAG